MSDRNCTCSILVLKYLTDICSTLYQHSCFCLCHFILDLVFLNIIVGILFRPNSCITRLLHNSCSILPKKPQKPKGQEPKKPKTTEAKKLRHPRKQQSQKLSRKGIHKHFKQIENEKTYPSPETPEKLGFTSRCSSLLPQLLAPTGTSEPIKFNKDSLKPKEAEGSERL